MAPAGVRDLTIRGLLVWALLGSLFVDDGLAAEIEPPDVYQSTMVVRGELERIREALDKPRDSRAEINIRNAQPREVFFQAVTL